MLSMSVCLSRNNENKKRNQLQNTAQNLQIKILSLIQI